MLLPILVLLACGLIAFQDLRERMVSWILFPILGLFLAKLYWDQTTPVPYTVSVLTNLALVAMVILLVWGYHYLRTKEKFINRSFGLGDLLFMVAMAFGFPSVTFIILFSTSIMFSLLLHVIQSVLNKQTTVPLAGYMSLFLMFALVQSYLIHDFKLYVL